MGWAGQDQEAHARPAARSRQRKWGRRCAASIRRVPAGSACRGQAGGQQGRPETRRLPEEAVGGRARMGGSRSCRCPPSENMLSNTIKRHRTLLHICQGISFGVCIRFFWVHAMHAWSMGITFVGIWSAGRGACCQLSLNLPLMLPGGDATYSLRISMQVY